MRTFNVGNSTVCAFDDGQVLVSGMQTIGDGENQIKKFMLSGVFTGPQALGNARQFAASKLLIEALDCANLALEKMQAFTASGPYGDGELYVQIQEALDFADLDIPLAKIEASAKVQAEQRAKLAAIMKERYDEKHGRQLDDDIDPPTLAELVEIEGTELSAANST